MIRVLQLVDRAEGFQSERNSGLLVRDLGHDFAVSRRVMGSCGAYAGSLAAISGLRKLRGDFDFIHAWGIKALTAAALAWRGRILFTPGDAPTRASIRWLGSVMVYRDVQVLCPTATIRRAIVKRGIPIDRCHLIRPGVDFSRVRRRRDSALRAALGFTDSDRVILLPHESSRQAGHREGLWAASILHVLEEKYKVLAWGRGPRMAAVAQFANRLGSAALLTVAEQRLQRPIEIEELLPAVDLVLVSATGPVATLPISICMAAALPMVATVSHTVSELLEDRHTALIAPQKAPKALARRVLDLEEDSNLRWSLTDMARTEAYEYFSLTRFVDQHRIAYRQVAGGHPVHLPELPPGAGLRFHGRG